MKSLLLALSLSFSLSYAAGTYDTYYFTDTQEKYSLHFLNTATTAELTGSPLATADASAIQGLRPITSLATVAANSNIAGKDMLYIREQSAKITIPDQSGYSDINASLGITIEHQNFLYGLTGLIVGMGFYFGFISLIVRAK